ncbi:MAG: alanine racemase [Ignavibacteriae bacterium]|nr:alanine racemase [Ignavibacteriota bacterium]
MAQITSPHPTKAKISLPAFRHNLGVVRSCVGNDVKIMAVVKSNAYGHGMRTIAFEAARNGAAYLGVARVDEGTLLRRDGVKHPILVFEVPIVEQIERALIDDLDLTIANRESADAVSSIAGKIKRRAKVHLKIDSGMGRLGFPFASAASDAAKIASLSNLEVVGIYSHLATSDEEDLTYARVQTERFADLIHQLEKQGVEIPLKHLANSGGIIALPESYFTMVRPGIMLYGYAPRNGMASSPPLQPVMSLVSRVSFMKTVAAQTSISYNRRYFTKTRTNVATVPIGYGDGYSRSLTNRGEVLIKGKRYPTVGTVCMDHIMIDVGDDDVAVGDEVILIGANGSQSLTAWDMAEKIGTIPYEITCNISIRVQRAFTS